MKKIFSSFTNRMALYMVIALVLMIITSVIKAPNILDNAASALYTVTWILYLVYMIKDTKEMKRKDAEFRRNQPLMFKRMFERVPDHIPDNQVDEFIRLKDEKERREKRITYKLKRYFKVNFTWMEKVNFKEE